MNDNVHTAKAQSGGDFVCHILQKMKTVWHTLFLFEMILWCMGYVTPTEQDFVFYPVLIFQIGFH
jgi:hypothetical protein